MESSFSALCVFLVASVLCAGHLVCSSAGNEFGQEKSYYEGSSPPTSPDYGTSPPMYPTTPSIPSYSPPDGLVPSSPSYGTPNYGPPDVGSSSYPPSPPSPYSAPPTTPSAPVYAAPPNGGSSPSTPPGGYYGTPSAPTGVVSSPPTPSTPDYGAPIGGTPVVPSTPDISTPSAPDISTPSTPDISTPDISTPSTPDASTPSFGFPGTGSGSCSFWNDHPDALPDILSLFSTISGLFGGGSSSVFGTALTLKEALSNKREDGYGSLLREGAASLLNSLVNKNFYYSTWEVKNKFNAALVSNHSAAVQAVEFQNANEGRMHP